MFSRAQQLTVFQGGKSSRLYKKMVDEDKIALEPTNTKK